MTAIEAVELVVERGGARILDRVSLGAAPGEFVGIVGPNGSGKSTLLGALAALERPASGVILMNGLDALALSPVARALSRSYLPQTREVAWSMSLEAVVALGRFAYGSPRRLANEDRAAVEGAIAAVGLDAFRTRSAHALSGGEAARMHLARALASQTPILIADEPTAALDLRHQLEIMEVLRAKADEGGTVVAALHDLDLARRFATRIGVMEKGRLVADAAPVEALDAARVASVFGVEKMDGGYRLSP